MNILSQFVAVCRKTPNKVFVWSKARQDAKDILKLYTKKDLLDFIGNGGLEWPQVIDKKPFLDKQESDTGMIKNAYRFSSNLKQMYIAFFYNSGGDKWNLKSFHKQEERTPLLRSLLEEAMANKKLEDKS